MPRFDAAIASAFRLRNSVLAEVLLIAFVYGVGVLIVWRHYMALDAATWYATPSAGGSKLSLAGMWYGYVSLPIFQFLLLPLVFPVVHLGALSLAGVTHRAEPGPDASGPRRRPGISLQHGLRLRPARRGARRAACRTCSPTASSTSAPRCPSSRSRSPSSSSFCCAWCSVRCWCSRPACAGEADGPARVRHAGPALRARVRRQVAARRRACRRAARRQRRHPVARRSGQQFRGGADHAHRAGHEGAVIQLAVATLAPIVPLVLTMMPLEELLKKLFGILF